LIKSIIHLNETRDKSADAQIERQQKVDKAISQSRAKAVAESPEILKALGITNLDEITKAIEAAAGAARDAVFTGVEEEFGPKLKELNDIVGKELGAGIADGVITFSESVLKKAVEDGRIGRQAADDFAAAVTLNNNKLKAANAEFDVARQESRTKAIEQALETIRRADANTINFLEVAADEQEQITDEIYSKRLAADKRYVEAKRKLGEDLNETELQQLEENKQSAIDLSNAKYDTLITSASFAEAKLLSDFKGNNDEQELFTRRFNLKILKLRKEKEKAELEIMMEYNELKGDETAKSNSKELAAWQETLGEINAIASQVAQLVSNVFDLVIQQQQKVVDGITENIGVVENLLQESQNKLDELEDDLEGKRSGRRDAVLRGIELEKQREQELVEEKIRLENKLAAEERKLAKQRKAAAITQALINGALAITNILATVPKFDFGVSTGVLIGVSAALTATQVALIAGQKFAGGGFTGDGTHRDETGHKVAGVVHNDEWVAPKWMVESPKYRDTIMQLEAERTGGRFAEGGFTSPNFGALSDAANSSSNTQVMRVMTQFAESNLQLASRPIYVKATEVTEVAANTARRVRATAIGG